MESHLLRSFVAMVQHKNLKDAATARHLSKTAVSRHLKELESAWKVELFARSHDGLHLTHAGEHLLPNVRHAINVLDALESPATDLIDHLTGTVAIGRSSRPPIPSSRSTSIRETAGRFFKTSSAAGWRPDGFLAQSMIPR